MGLPGPPDPTGSLLEGIELSLGEFPDVGLVGAAEASD